MINKKLIYVILTFFSLTNCNIHLNQIKKEYQYSKDKQKFEYHKQLFINFYEFGGFDAQVKSICNEALKYFSTFSKNHNSAIIFDIDETALSNYPICKEKNFEWSLDNDVTPYRDKAICPAIQPVLAFYQQLLKLGFKIIFLTSRRATLYKSTYKNLIEKGYTNFENLILLPMDKFEAGVKHEEWKAQMRKEISKRYIISGSVSDSAKDFEGGNVGFKVKLPNYLY